MKRIALSMLLALWLPLVACSADEPAQASQAPAVADAAEAPNVTEGVETRAPAVEDTAGPAGGDTGQDTTGDVSADTAEPAQAAVDEEAQRMRLAAAAAQFVEGEHYERLNPTQPTSSSPDEVEVAEAFMYTCPHCYSFEPHVRNWLERKPAAVSFVRIPVNFNQVAALHLRAYYVAETLGVLDELHETFFTEIHVNKNIMPTREALADFFAKHGVDRDAFNGTWESFAVDSKMRRAETMARRYGVRSVPTVIVNGKYRTDGRMAGSYQRMFEVVDYLVAVESGVDLSPPAVDAEASADSG